MDAAFSSRDLVGNADACDFSLTGVCHMTVQPEWLGFKVLSIRILD